MTALAINLLALLIVLGLCWTAMMWLSGRFHGQRSVQQSDELYWDTDSAAVAQRHANQAPSQAQASRIAPEAPCAVCEGVGAHTSEGRLAPCPECYGTGVLSQ